MKKGDNLYACIIDDTIDQLKYKIYIKSFKMALQRKTNKLSFNLVNYDSFYHFENIIKMD